MPAIRKRYNKLSNKKEQATKLGFIREIQDIDNVLLVNYYLNQVSNKKRVLKIEYTYNMKLGKNKGNKGKIFFM